MSRIHQALTRTAPTANSTSRFNPLRRSNPAGPNRLWWLVAALALVLTTLVIWAPWQGTKPTLPAEAVSTLAQSAPQPSNEAPPVSTPTPAPQPTAATPAAVATPAKAIAPASGRDAEEPNPAAPAQTPATPLVDEPPPTPSAATASNTEAAAAPTQTATAAAASVEPRADTRIQLDTDHQDAVQRALSNGDLAAAEMTLRRWIGEQPDADQPRLWLAKLLLAQDRLDAIGALLDGQTSSAARALLAVWHEKAGRPAQAVVLFEQLAREQPRHSAWQLHWAINAENSGQLALARLLYQTYLDRFAADNPSLTAFADQRIRSLERP